MNRCIISGLLERRVNVEDLRSYPLPLARYAVRSRRRRRRALRRSRRTIPTRSDRVLDASASTSTRAPSARSKISSSARTSARTPMDERRRPRLPLAHARAVQHRLHEALDREALRAAKFRVVHRLRARQRLARVAAVLSNLGIDRSRSTRTSTAPSCSQFRQTASGTSNSSRTSYDSLEADSAFSFDSDGETLALVDDRGRIIAGTACSRC